MDKTAAAARLTREMRDAEEALAKTLSATTALMHTAALALEANPETDRAIAYKPLARMHKAIGGLMAVDGDLARVHSGLLDVAVERGAFDEPTCPKKTFTGASLDDDRRIAG